MIRIGVDFGGTKIEAAALGPDGTVRVRTRVPNPGGYDASIAAMRGPHRKGGGRGGAAGAASGSASPARPRPGDGRIRNANSTWLNGRPLGADLEQALGRPVRLANDANCFALSEALEGAGAGAASVFGVIVGTGCGGGDGDRRASSPAPTASPANGATRPCLGPAPRSIPARRCWCGRYGCMEMWVSGDGVRGRFRARATRRALEAPQIVAEARGGRQAAAEGGAGALHRPAVARRWRMIADILDPEVIVLGGGMSNVDGALSGPLPERIAAHAFSDVYSRCGCSRRDTATAPG